MEETTDTSLSELSVRELTERLATRAPVPGGGSAAALAGAMGAALVSMVAELTIGRPDAAEHDAELTEIRDAATAHRSALLDLAEEDADAYAAVVASRRMPKETDLEREERAVAMRTAMRAAADVPLRTAELTAEVVDLARRIAPIGNRNAASDAGVAAQLASAATRGALLNVRINLPYLPPDEPLRERAGGMLERLAAAATEGERAALASVEGRLEPS